MCMCVWMMWQTEGGALCVCVDDVVRLGVEPCVCVCVCVCVWMMWSD